MAICDRELLNTTIRHEEMEIFISDKFYGSVPVTEEEVRSALQKADNVNLMGKRSVGLAIQMGLVCENGCIYLGSIPHAQIFRL
ncbi:MAG TPA: DUF424 domain-containing protein [Methanomicrobiales archaeon]|nr:DUF424 domain-containing protein [Methanomicrobiales archaeon]